MIHSLSTNRCQKFTFAVSLFYILFLGHGMAEERKTDQPDSKSWQEKSTEYARIMSHIKWTPVAGGMPKREGHFTEGVEYTGVPYSSVKSVGRYIGFDIYLKTFLAAVENPNSVVYTENLYGEVANAECYYGKVCSSYTSYALQCGIWYLSRLSGPDHRKGIVEVDPKSGSNAKVGDIIFRPPAKVGGGSHILIVTAVTKGSDGEATHVRVEESTPETTRDTNRSVADFDEFINLRNRKLYRITDLDAWREGNRSDSFLFPNYEEDSTSPVINRVLLLDRGDWVPYHKGQAVKFNIMDRDSQSVKTLVIKRGDQVIETIEKPGKGVIERSFFECDDYSAHCVMMDDSLSQPCKFAVCDLRLSIPEDPIALSKPWEVDISAENMNAIILYFKGSVNTYMQHSLFVSEQERQNGKIVVPANLFQHNGKMEVWLIGENKYGRLKKRLEFVAKG